MEVENGGLEDDFSLQGASFHFHDYGRKGNIDMEHLQLIPL